MILWWDKTKQIYCLKVDVMVFVTCTRSKNPSFTYPSLSRNLITKAICSFLDSSQVSSTIKQHFTSLISLQIWLYTSLTKIFKICFWIVGDVYFAFCRAFSNTISSIFWFYKAKSFIIPKKLLCSFNPMLLSCLLKAHTWKVSHLTTSTKALRHKWFFKIC